MNLNQLYYFRTVAKLEHFRKAASELNISQPSLSNSMANLESELGLCLFEKQGRNVTLTKYGRIFLKDVERILNELENAKKKMQQLASGDTGHVDIAYISPLAHHYIPNTVRNFLDLEDNKNVTFTFNQGFTNELIKGLKSDKYDLIFSSYVEEEPDITFVPIIEQELFVIVPLNHPLGKLNNIDLVDIKSYPLVGYDRDSGLGKFISNLLRSINIKPKIICEAADEYAITALVSAGFGISIIAEAPALKHAKIKKLKITNPKYSRKIYLAYKKNRIFPPAVHNFISYIKKKSIIEGMKLYSES
ncbi:MULTISPECIES: LysR family transcriptional regulator [Clostridium]|uniref:Transcriptional regulator n=3 Tax=Clostridium TaxID=1485 RepID=D8GP47_CLOLD|nr:MULTISPECIES: LysR family transcriptional regulator [Clostridium]ADK15925.1 transcriptional regulator [Clostridium ljungdahlii DSM 13528]AGY75099.1 LysR family transcriptional regulator [Clostridium autoethanogenum DSM 10061]ALU35271.1 Transcriptional regulator LysR family [Clostridium autoethanogenum DSM 10061]OAA87197.1 HTH-type transcriptional regulator GltC [Clostridium ljungdahlii DSM 13528]OVY49650.1 HTH-type transcriptional regulator GltC [Clostridium autoethanogenum]